MTTVELARLLPTYGVSPQVQTDQIEFRKRIAEQWPIREGDRLLEVGCGQGDMSVVLADRIGGSGRLIGIDPAPADYGHPISLGQSLAMLAEGALGDRMSFHLGEELITFVSDVEFDAVVMAHCSWYFNSTEALAEAFRAARSFAPRLYLSEWSLWPARPEQMAHALAITILGQVQAVRPIQDANVRTPRDLESMQNLLDHSGWEVSSVQVLEDIATDDGRWEIALAEQLATDASATAELPPRLIELLRYEVAMLRETAARFGKASLPSYALVAERKGL